MNIFNLSTLILTDQFTVAVDVEKVEDVASQRLSSLQKRVQIKGFRRGKAPLKMVRNHYGRKLENVAIDRFAVDVAENIIAEKILQPVGRPTINIGEKNG